MENKDFELRYNLTGSDRKRLVTSIAEILNSPAKYKGAPSFTYEVDYFTIDKNGTISFDDRADSEEIEKLIERLHEQGFEAEPRFEDLQMTEEKNWGLADSTATRLAKMACSKRCTGREHRAGD
jgi:Txe/YoeB family toxin of Txe-Axe toxin-antitoxin module